MPRKPRIVVPNFPHHVTQRGNRKQDVFFTPTDRYFFLEKLLEYAERFSLEIICYCRMSDHTHLIVVPETAESMGQTFKRLHMHYSQYLNKKHQARGRNWQGRYFSSPMDENYTYKALSTQL